jgi:hypothetical protein
MKTIAASTHRAPDDDHAWLGDAGVPRSREDRVAEIVTAIALLFSLGIGLVIALLPVSAKAVSVRPVSRALQFSVVETTPPAAWSVRCQPCSAQQVASTGGQHEPSVLRRN